MIAAFLCGSPGLGMDHLALSELGRTMVPITRLIGDKPRRKADPPQTTMDRVGLDLVTAYAAEDADVTLQLYELFKPRLDELGMADLAADVEMPLVEVLATMEAHGITVDPDELDRQREHLERRAVALRSEILDAAQVDFNPDSPKQLGDVLFNQLGFPVQRKTKTGYSTDAEVLDKLATLAPKELDKVPDHAKPIPALIVEYRMLTKLVGTYFGNLVEAISPRDGRVHASFHQTGAATGRLSSSNPNLQNIPIRTEVGREIRRAFVAAPGHVLVSADYSQVELRMLAHLSDDPALVDAFNGGEDIHTAVAARVFDVPPADVTGEQRGHAKTINFGIIYGVTPFGLARRIEGLDLDGATRLIDEYKATYAGIDRFLERLCRAGAGRGVRHNDPRSAAVDRAGRQPQPAAARPRRTPRHQLGGAGQRGRPDQGRDGQPAPADRARHPARKDAVADPRRTRRRVPGGRSGRDQRGGGGGDGRGDGAEGAAARGPRRRAGLVRGEVERRADFSRHAVPLNWARRARSSIRTGRS